MTGAAFEQQAVAAHDVINPFCICTRLAQRVPASPQQPPSMPVAIRGQVGNQFSQLGDDLSVIPYPDFAGASPRCDRRTAVVI